MKARESLRLRAVYLFLLLEQKAGVKKSASFSMNCSTSLAFRCKRPPKFSMQYKCTVTTDIVYWYRQNQEASNMQEKCGRNSPF